MSASRRKGISALEGDDDLSVYRSTNGKLRWKQVIQRIARELERHFKNELKWYPPPLRSMFYHLEALRILKKGGYDYDTLSRETAKARMLDEVDGGLPVDCFSDMRRKVIQNSYQDDNEYKRPEEFAEEEIDYLKRASDRYLNTIPIWYKQKNYVEIWIEKEELVGGFISLLEAEEKPHRYVRIVANSGFSGLGFLNANWKRLEEITSQAIEKDIHILYFGDYDPSGYYMDRDIQERLKKLNRRNYSEVKVNFRRVALTREQCIEFDLPSKDLPMKYNPKTGKMEYKDLKAYNFLAEQVAIDGRTYVCDLHALIGPYGMSFKKILQEAVDDLYNEGIYEQVIREHLGAPEQVSRLVGKKVMFLDEEDDAA